VNPCRLTPNRRSCAPLTCRLSSGYWLLGLTLLLSATAQSQSADYHKDVEPILRLHCVSCHTDRSEWWGGSSTRGVNFSSFQKTMAGSTSGPTVVPGHPEASLLYKVISTSNEDIRMPFAGQPLSQKDVATIRQWIIGGAKEDTYIPPYQELAAPGVQLQDLGITGLRVECRVMHPAFLVLDAIDGDTIVEHHEAVISSFVPKDYGTAAITGGFVTWFIDGGLVHLPQTVVTLRLRVYSGSPDYNPTVFFVDYRNGIGMGHQANALVDFEPNPLQITTPQSMLMKFWLDNEADVAIDVFPGVSKTALSSESLADLAKGLNYYTWNAPHGHVLPGKYLTVMRETEPFTHKPILTVAADFQVGAANH
jgi:Planctomycete cytochrome C